MIWRRLNQVWTMAVGYFDCLHSQSLFLINYDEINVISCGVISYNFTSTECYLYVHSGMMSVQQQHRQKRQRRSLWWRSVSSVLSYQIMAYDKVKWESGSYDAHSSGYIATHRNTAASGPLTRMWEALAFLDLPKSPRCSCLSKFHIRILGHWVEE